MFSRMNEWGSARKARSPGSRKDEEIMYGMLKNLDLFKRAYPFP